MLTNFFGKSKPINFILVSCYVITGYLFHLIMVSEIQISLQQIVKHILIIFASLFLLFLLNFIVRKNHLTKVNTYSVLLFGCFMTLIPVFFSETNLLLSNVFLLLALRRILNFPSGENMEKKVLDAAIWISLASLFYFWSFVFFLVLFTAILQNNSKNLKTLLIPFVGMGAVFVLATTYSLIVADSFLWFSNIENTISLDFSVYKEDNLLIPVAFLLI